MRYLALCCDYDGTIAHHGRVDEPTHRGARAPARVGPQARARHRARARRAAGRSCRASICSSASSRRTARSSTGPRPARSGCSTKRRRRAFVDKLIERGVGPISVGRVIVATWEPHENTVLKTIRDCGLELQVIFNKGAVMVLPAGVNKATGLRAALAELNLSPHNAVGVGDAENDHAFLNICECCGRGRQRAAGRQGEGRHRDVRGSRRRRRASSSTRCSPTISRAARAARSRGTTSCSARTRKASAIAPVAVPRERARRRQLRRRQVDRRGGARRAAARSRATTSASSIRKATTTASNRPSCSATPSMRRRSMNACSC